MHRFLTVDLPKIQFLMCFSNYFVLQGTCCLKISVKMFVMRTFLRYTSMKQ